MFNFLLNLRNLDISMLNTENVNDMSHMFEDSSILTSIDISKFSRKCIRHVIYVFRM